MFDSIVNDEVRYPRFLSTEAIGIMRRVSPDTLLLGADAGHSQNGSEAFYYQGMRAIENRGRAWDLERNVSAVSLFSYRSG